MVHHFKSKLFSVALFVILRSWEMCNILKYIFFVTKYVKRACWVYNFYVLKRINWIYKLKYCIFRQIIIIGILFHYCVTFFVDVFKLL